MNNLLTKKHIDGAVIYVILQRGWSSIAGLITLLLLIRYLTKIELGYYYAFSSLIGIQMVFELGLTTIIRQFISHDMAHLKMTRQRFISGKIDVRVRLLKLIVKSLKIYSIICLCILIVITPIGLLFFSDPNASMTVDWKFPWFLLVLFSTLNCFASVVTAVIEGLGFISRVKRVLLISTIISSVAVWFTLLSGHGLYAPVLLNAVNFICVIFWVWKHFKRVFIQAYRVDLRHEYINYQTKWKADVWPLQWRVAVSWIGGYFIFYIINPVAFKYYGPEFSGQIGITFQVLNLMLAMSASLIATKMPYFGQLISKRDYLTLNSYYTTIEIVSSMFFLLMSVAAIVFLLVLHGCEVIYADRFLPVGLFSVLLVMTFFRNLINCHACYIRSYKQERHSINSVMTGLLTCFVLFLSGNLFSSDFYIISYACVVILFSYPHSLLLYLKFRRNHACQFDDSHSNL